MGDAGAYDWTDDPEVQPRPKRNGKDPNAVLGYLVHNSGEEVGLPIPPREWILEQTFCKGFLSGMIAIGGGGKTAVRLAQAMSCAIGIPLTGQRLFHRCNVLFVGLEDGETELRRRIEAARLHFGVSDEQLIDALYYWCPMGFKIARVSERSNDLFLEAELCQALRTIIAQHRIGLVLIDPLIKAAGVPENNNTAMDGVMVLLAKVAVECNCAVDVLHHIAKGGSLQAGDSDRARGASAVRDAVRLLQTVTPMTEQDAEFFGLSATKRRAMVRLDTGKTNLAPPIDRALWFELVGVLLGNGTAEYPRGDEIQVAKHWPPPDAWEVVRPVVTPILQQIQEGPKEGRRYSPELNASVRGAWKVVRSKCGTERISEKQAQKVINDWLEEGVLVKARYYDPVAKDEVWGVQVEKWLG
jgi:hypothetical protein